MKLILRKVRYKNFLSTGNQWTEIDLVSSPTTLIVGTNGSGKSTFLDAISFGLFNKPFRKINKPSLVNTITNKNCVVEIEFSVGVVEFKVVRGIKPNIFEIYKGEELITQSSDNRDYQDAFEKYILKINHKSFCQVVVLGSAIFTPFMSLAKGDRRNIIEDLLDLKIFTTMNILLKQHIDNTSSQIYHTERDLTIIQEKLKLTYEHIKELQENNERSIQEKKDRIQQTKINIETLETELSEINSKIETLEEKRNGEEEESNKAKEYSKIKHQLHGKISHFHKEIDFLKENDQCPTCEQLITDEYRTRAIEGKQSNLAELQTGFSRLEDQIGKIKKRLERFVLIQEQIDAERKKEYSTKLKINNHKGYIKELERDIKQVQKENIQEVKKPVELEDDQKKLEEKIAELHEVQSVQQFASLMLKDTGIKARIIKAYIPIINQLISKYTSILDFFVDFRLNEEFEETILSRFRDTFEYNSFSQGEKLRLDLAILFTFRSIAKMRNTIDCNLIVLDEILDGAMDNEGIDNLMKLILSLTDNENIFIISHKDQMIDKFENVIQFDKVSNFSRGVKL